MLHVLRDLGVLPAIDGDPSPGPVTDVSQSPDDSTDAAPTDTRTVAWIEGADRDDLLAECDRLDLEVNPRAKIGTLRKVLIENLPG
jgi:hypothetical protein